MNKKIIALAIGAAVAAPMAAQAEVTTYGHGQVEITSWGGDVEGMSVADFARGRIGFKSAEDLGNGMKAIAKMEFKVDTADGDSNAACANAACTKTQGISLQKREMMIGLKGGFGTFQMGRLKSAYKYNGGVKYDAFVTTALEARGNGGMTGKAGKGNAYGHNSFISDSIAYKNKFGAVDFWLTYDLDDGGPAAPGGANGGNGMTLGAKFTGGNFEAGVAIANDGEVAEYSATKFFGKMNFGAHTVLAQLESTDNNGAETDVTFVGYQMKMGKNKIVAQIGQTDPAGQATDYLAVGVWHAMSKKTKVYAGYRSTETGPASVDATTVGMRVVF